MANRNNLHVGCMLLHGPEVLRAIRSKAEKTNQLKKKSYLTVQIGSYGKNLLSAVGLGKHSGPLAELVFPIGTFHTVNEIYLSPRRQCYFTLFDFTEATNYKTFNEF